MYSINCKNNTNDNSKNTQSIVTIGNFDGLHLGHLQLFMALQSLKQNYLSAKLIVVTFEPLPIEYFTYKKHNTSSLKDIDFNSFGRLSLLRDKLLFLQQLNFIDSLVVLKFNDILANMSATQFIQDVLIDELNAVHMVLGNDFRFGKYAHGSALDFKPFNIPVTVVDNYVINGCKISSSIIRQYALNNDLTNVKQYLGHNIKYSSRVIYGMQLGRKFGVPTINLNLTCKPILWGIYVAYVYIENIQYRAVASIGKNPTVSSLDTYKLEAHLLDIDLDLYGKVATIEFLCFLRHEAKFTDLDSLFKQIHLDIVNTRTYFLK